MEDTHPIPHARRRAPGPARAALAALLLLAAAPALRAQTDDGTDEIDPEVLEQLRRDRIDPATGEISLGAAQARLSVPAGFGWLDRKKTGHLLVDYWENDAESLEDVLGALVPEGPEAFYEIETAYVVSWEGTGYVSDRDAGSIDYDDLLRDLRKATAHEPVRFVDWAAPPRYDRERKVLFWGKRVASDGREFLNFDMRILGRRGMILVNAVADEDALPDILAAQDALVAAFRFDPGAAYADYDPATDRKSDWTVGALVGGGLLAAKTGLLAKLGLLLVKAWKLVVVAFVAVGAFVRRVARGRRGDRA